MERRNLLGVALTAWLALPALAVSATPTVQVYKSPHCTCCAAWVAHMRRAGFTVDVVDVAAPAVMRERLGMPNQFGSCHTATVGGYVLEGHVPADEVRRLLATRPNALGLAVPSMPPGSPGMEVGSRQDPYRVLLIDREGHESTYASYPK